MVKIGWLCAVAALMAAVAYGWNLHRARSVDVERRHSAKDDGLEMQSQLRALDQTIRDLRTRLERAEARVSNAGPAVPTDENSIPTSQPGSDSDRTWVSLPAKERNQLLVSSTNALLNDVLDGEARDIRASRDAVTAVENMLVMQGVQGTELASVDCTTTLCRLQFAHESQEAWTQFSPIMRRELPVKGNAFFHFDRESKQTVIFVARNGQDLPQVDLREVILTSAY